MVAVDILCSPGTFCVQKTQSNVKLHQSTSNLGCDVNTGLQLVLKYNSTTTTLWSAPQIWMDYITLILSELEDKKKYIAIMDDLLIHSTKMAHWKLLEQLLKSMCKNGLRLSPKKCQLFKTKLTYMGNEFSINRRTMTITPLRSRTEAINKIPTPRAPNQCKSFCGVVNYLSLVFCPDLQKLLKPIVDKKR